MGSPSESFNWAIIAPGKIAGKFASDLQYVPDAKVHAVASRSIQRAQAFATQYSAPHAVGSYEALLGLPDIDCVYIASPHTSHFDHTMMCLEAGLNVLCEKPFAMQESEVQQMVDKAKEKGVFLMEALWTRFFPFMNEVDHLIDNGVIGKPWSLTADFGFRAVYDATSRLFDKALGGGALLDIGIYPLFMALYQFGYPDMITAKAEFADTGADTIVHVTLEYADGRTANLHSTIVEDTKCDCVIRGDQGEIIIHPRFHESRSISFITNHDDMTIDCGFEGRGYRWEIAHVQKCVQEGLKESPLMPFEFSLQLMRLLDEVRGLIGLAY